MSGVNMRVPTWADIGALVLAKLGLRKNGLLVARIVNVFEKRQAL